MGNPRSLNTADTIINAAGQIIGGLSHAQFGQQAQQAAQFQAEQLRQNAGQAQAGAQRAAYDIDRQSQYVASAALASAAASGGGASDPTVINLIAKNAGEFAYRKAVALYQGAAQARAMNLSVDAKEYEGESVRSNSDRVAQSEYFKAGTSLLQGTARDSSLLQKFGAGGPKQKSGF